MRYSVKYYMLLSVLGASFCGCSNSDDLQGEGVSQFSVAVQATKGSGDIESDTDTETGTRALFLGGNNGNRFYSIWDSGDLVEAYKSGSFVGTLQPKDIGEAYSELVGTLTGSFAVNDEIELYLPHTGLDFTNQKGTVADISANHSFLKETTKVTAVNNGEVTTERVEFFFRNSYVHFTFVDEDGMRLHVEQLIIHADGGKLVHTKTKEGAATYGDLTINLDKERGEYPSDVYVSLHNDLEAKDMYTFTVKAGGYTYCSNGNSNSYINANLVDGKSYNANKTLSLQGSASRIQSSSEVSNFENGNGDTGESGSVTF